MEIIRIIVSCLTLISVSWVIGLVGVSLRHKAEEQQVNTLKVPKLIFWVGLGEALMCYIVIICIFIFAFNEENAAWSIGFFLMSCLGIWIILYALNWQITLQEDSFIFRNMFGKKNIYKYEDIVAIKHLKIGGYRLYIGKRSIAIDYFITGQQLLWNKISTMNISMK